MVTEDYVSFETAKLLKEKGFDGLCRAFWKEFDGEVNLCDCNSSHKFEYCHNTMLDGYNDSEETNIAAPTLQMAMKWLRDIHNLHIAVIVAYHHIPRRYEAHIMKLENIDDFILHPQVDFDSYEDACEAAIKYCLENLI